MALRDTHKVIDEKTKRTELLQKVELDYTQYGEHKMNKVKSSNIMIIGRTRSGKSTIKLLLLDPTKVPEELTLKSGTRDALIESFYIADRGATLNIIDTPGLFERGDNTDNIRSNDTILKTIEKCANMEITWFNMVCFCVAITVGINSEDVQAIELFIKHLGDEISNNACLIVTHCESKNEEQRQTIRKELENDQFFTKIAPYFKLGVFFSGSINRDNYNKGNECIIDEYLTISDYRKKLIELFTSDIKPFPITETKISEIRRAHESEVAMLNQLQNAENVARQHEFNEAGLKNILKQQERTVNQLERESASKDIKIHELEDKCKQHEDTIKMLKEQCRLNKRITTDLERECDQLNHENKDWSAKCERLKSKVDEQQSIIQDLYCNDRYECRVVRQKYPKYFSDK